MNRFFAPAYFAAFMASVAFFPLSVSANSNIDLTSLVQNSGISYGSLLEGILGEPISNDLPKDWHRTYDGSKNNKQNPLWGAANTPLLRTGDSHYWDNIGEPAGQNRPSTREISNIVIDQDGLFDNDRNLSDMVWQWGQFLDHDIALTPELHPEENFEIPVPTGDPFFDPFHTGTEKISLHRSVYDKSDGGGITRPREQMNVISSFIDGSNVYGSDEERVNALRTFSGGRLKTSPGDLLPKNVDGIENAGGTDPEFFIAGDIRANEQTALTSMHTLFVREHNYWADAIRDAFPILSDELIFQLARKIVIAEMQAITYNEFLPALFGKRLPQYSGYDPSLHPGLYNEFSTAAYRFGHSTISANTIRLDNNGNVAPGGHLSLRESFFVKNNHSVYEDVGYIMKGLASQKMQEIDEKVVDDLRNFLFGPPGAGGLDLAALNLQRGRDHGLPSYNHLREYYGLPPVQGFSDITSNTDLQNSLQSAYGHVSLIDPWIGMLSEDHLPGASVGKTMKAVLEKQFLHLREGDRYWYEKVFSSRNRDAINKTTLSDIIKRNTQISQIQDNVFFVEEPNTSSPVNSPVDDPKPTLPEQDTSPDPDPQSNTDLEGNPVYCSLGFSPSTIGKGEGTTIWWWTDNADSATINNGIGEVDIELPHRWFYPEISGTYTMTVNGPGGQSTCETHLTISSEYTSPPVCAIGFSPAVIKKGQGTALWWWSEGADSGSIDGLGEIEVPEGYEWMYPQESGEYTIELEGIGGNTSCSAEIEVE
jgi:hypothetical protein